MAQTDRVLQNQQTEDQQTADQDKTSQQNLEQFNQAMATQLTPLIEVMKDMQQKQTVLESQVADQKLALQSSQQSQSQKPVNDINSLIDSQAAVDDDKIEGLSKRQMLDVITSSFDNALAASNESVKNHIADVNAESMKKVEAIEKMTLGMYAGMDLDRAKSTHEDFTKFIPEIKAVMEQHPGMTYEDAYLLAKSRKAGSVSPSDHIDTEKPTGSVNNSVRRVSQDIQSEDDKAVMAARGKAARGGITGSSLKSGVQGFRGFVGDALEKILEDD